MKAIGKLFKILTKTVLWAIFLALIIPVGYFAVRMGQPMDLPEYKGLTYYQYVEWEKFEQEKSGAEYEATHEVNYPVDSWTTAGGCIVNDLAFGHVGLFLSQGPALILDTVLLDRPFDAVHFLPNWWANFEKQHLIIMRENSNGPVCNIPSVIPDDYALSVGAQLPEPDIAQQ